MEEIEAVLPVDLFGDSPDTRSIKILKEFEPEEGYWLAFSGGKDSVVLYDLAVRSGVKFDAHYNLTTIDPPELVQFIKKQYPDVIFEKPKKSFWQFIREGKGLPLRNSRWCCEELKEWGGSGRRCLTGVRAEESSRRSKYGVVQPCNKTSAKGKVLIHPILHWKKTEIWDYIHKRGIPYCSLYDEGWTRLGCVICPFESKIDKCKEKWPKIFEGVLRAIKIAYPKKQSFHKFGSPEAVMEWWLQRNLNSPNEDQEVFVFDQFDDE